MEFCPKCNYPLGLCFCHILPLVQQAGAESVEITVVLADGTKVTISKVAKKEPTA